jgi:two-component sensor histidine kinase
VLEPLGAWALAAALFLLVLALQLEADTLGRPYPFLVFFPAILLAAWLAGRSPGIAVAACSAAASWWFLIRSPGTLAWPTPPQAAALALFLGTGVFAAWLTAGLTRAVALARQAQQAAEAALGAQSVLAAELQHRVANNLQCVASALSLQARRMGDTQAAAALLDARRRIDAVGRLHRTLVSVDADDDAERLLEGLCRTQLEAAADSRVALEVEVTPGLTLDAGRLTLVGMIVSEAISNALKHSRADGQGLRLLVSLHRLASERLALEVRDNGGGLPDGFELTTTKSLGLRIVRSMARQLDGTLSLTGGRGAVLRVVFPAADPSAA